MTAGCAESQTEPCRVMVDIETVGLNIGAAIVEIGAVEFGHRELGDTFHRSVSLTSSQEAGLTIDADTVEWWLGKHPEVAPEVLVGGDDLGTALDDAIHQAWVASAILADLDGCPEVVNRA